MRSMLCLFFIAISLYSCTSEKVRVRPEKRVAISGTVFNGNQPMVNIPVVTYGAFGEFVFDNPLHRLGLGRTNSFGDFNFISLDTYNSNLSISVNPTFHEHYNDHYATLYFVDLEDNHGTFVTLNEIALPQKVIYTVRLQNTSNTQERLFYTLTYKNQELYYLITRRAVNENDNYYHSRNNRTLTNSWNVAEETREEILFTVEGSEIIFNYILGENEPVEIIIPVTMQENLYVFEF